MTHAFRPLQVAAKEKTKAAPKSNGKAAAVKSNGKTAAGKTPAKGALNRNDSCAPGSEPAASGTHPLFKIAQHSFHSCVSGGSQA